MEAVRDLSFFSDFAIVISSIIGALPEVIIWLGVVSFSSVLLISIMLHIRR